MPLAPRLAASARAADPGRSGTADPASSGLKAKRVAMADLRQLIADLGYANVRTLLNSGNLVFDSGRKVTAAHTAAIQEAIATKTGATANLMVVSTADLATVVAENPLVDVVKDPSRCLVAFRSSGASLARAAVLLDDEWGPDQLALGTKAAYLWCAGGLLDSPMAKAFDRLMRDAVTTRNWATVLKLHAMSQ
jgi:uncharacterized protein (DUF1697 family)